MKSKLFTAALAALVLASCAPKENGYFDNLPQEASPIEIGNKITNRFLEQFAIWQPLTRERTKNTNHLSGCMHLVRRTLVCSGNRQQGFDRTSESPFRAFIHQ